MESPFARSTKELIEVYKNRRLTAFLLIFSILYTLMVYYLFIYFLQNYLSYFSLGALIIKTKGIQNISSLLPYLLASPLVTILSFVSPSLFYVYFAFIAIKKNLGRKINRKEREEATKKGIIFFILFYFTLAFISSLLSPLLLFNSYLYAFLIFLIFYATFFVPYALVIDDYTIVQALLKGFQLIKKKPLDPLLWALLLSIILSALFIIIDLISRIAWPSGIIVDRIVFNELLLFYINQMFVIPYGIILASYLYLSRYPMVRV